MQGRIVRTCWGRDMEAGFSDLNFLSLSIVPQLLKEAWGGPGVLVENIGLLDHIFSSQLVHPVWLFSGYIQQLPGDGCSPAKKIATWSLRGLSPRWTLPPPKPPTWGPLWLLLLLRLLDSCPEPQSMGHDILNDSYSLFVHWPSDRTCSQMVSEQGGREGGSALAPPAGSRRVPPQGLELGINCSSPRWNVLPWVPTRVTAPGLGNLISPA